MRADLPVSTHSRAEAAAGEIQKGDSRELVSTHSRAEAAAVIPHKASQWLGVSTHSRAEAAAQGVVGNGHARHCFNTQPRGGGCCD